ncbi:hypothetical protein CHGG_04809 [Chaetomium globosum CBS 148.51]|uniref:Uncharacterized protein n=1 Tax=Chaetomium globosum (strain ATCC 6205 / CBS 148.51 / DSM 1962 / NBRC 6347 / NRRL 1970) TaxID=306901 RepID=Q2H087_CHAGB|nr:uncharacterized protein CHGG_04809 [Chaetomium globosum CBS 148.51]EAQ88190.1 hypothetical protein CHGG_04809 [Chaetomium globosum CBS 148.51]
MTARGPCDDAALVGAAENLCVDQLLLNLAGDVGEGACLGSSEEPAFGGGSAESMAPRVDSRMDRIPKWPPSPSELCRVQQQQEQQRNNSGASIECCYKLNSLNPEVAEYLQVPPKAMQRVVGLCRRPEGGKSGGGLSRNGPLKKIPPTPD